jgi:hypothetical protein
MLIFGTAIPLSEKAAMVNGEYAQAMSICQHKIDQLRGLGYTNIKSYTALHTAGIVDDSPTVSPYSFAAADSLSTTLINPTATITIADMTGQANKVAQVTVTLTWKAATYGTKTCTLTLYALIANTS